MRIDLNNYEAFLLDYFEGNLNENELNELKTFALLHPELNIDLGKNELPYFSKEDLISDFKTDLFKSDENVPDERLIAYVEGTLSETEKQKFEKELEADKTLLAELKLYKESILKPNKQIVFENKQHLLKNEDELLLSNQMLLYVEGLLDGDEKQIFETKIKNNSTLKSELELFTKTKLSSDIEIIHPDKESLKKQSRVIVLFSARTVASIAAAILLIIGFAIVFNNFNSEPEPKKELSSKGNIAPINEIKKDSDSRNQKLNVEQFVSKNTNVANNVSSSVKLPGKKESAGSSFLQPQNLIANTSKDSANNASLYEKPLLANNTKDSASTASLRETNPIVAISKKDSIKPEPVNYNKQTTLLAYEEDDEILEQSEETKKPGIWKRAARLAKQLNGLGMKAVNGEEKSGDKFLLSFNALSIEKK